MIHEVALDEGRVRVYASDNVRVAGVRVSVLDGEGNLVEQGEATGLAAALGWWVYTPGSPPKAGGKLAVEARDLAGNVTRVGK
ncbi:MAG: hypothetical protein WA821_21085 [Anaerolineales bacterium]